MDPISAKASRRVAVISNRNSGHNRDQFEKISARLARVPGLSQHTTTEAAELPDLLAQLAGEGIDLLAINGGDGTAARIFNELLSRKPFTTLPVIALLPGGTANMTAGDIGIKGSLQKAVARFCHWCETNPEPPQTVARHVLKIDTGQGASHYGMFAGAGAVIQATEYAHANVHSRGLRDDFSLGLTMARAIWGLLRKDPRFSQSSTISMALDDEEFVDYPTLILAASTLDQLFLGTQPFWGTGSAPLKSSLIEAAAPRFLRSFLSILAGKPSRFARAGNGYHSHRSQQVRLLMDGRINFDGELLDIRRDQGPVRISCAGPLQFLQLPA